MAALAAKEIARGRIRRAEEPCAGEPEPEQTVGGRMRVASHPPRNSGLTRMHACKRHACAVRHACAKERRKKRQTPV